MLHLIVLTRLFIPHSSAAPTRDLGLDWLIDWLIDYDTE